MSDTDMKTEVPTKWGDERRGWHFDKTVSITNLLTALVMVVSMISWAMYVDRRIEQNVQAIKYLSQSQTATKQQVDDQRREIKSDLRAINDKLDRLIERQIR